MAASPQNRGEGSGASRPDDSGSVRNGNPSMSSTAENLARALGDLARGEQTATALEANLTSLESKLDEILAAFGVTMEEEGKGEGDGAGAGAGAQQKANDQNEGGDGAAKN